MPLTFSPSSHLSIDKLSYQIKRHKKSKKRRRKIHKVLRNMFNLNIWTESTVWFRSLDTIESY